MHRVSGGDLPLLSELYERHHRRLFRYCWRITGETQASEDLVQEVFLKMLRNRQTFSEGNTFSSWMYAIARNAHSDAYRKRRKEMPLEGEPHLAAPPGEPVECREESALLHRALMQLPEEKREVLVMSRFQDMTHAEIARVLGCDERTSRTRLHRALKSLRQVYLASVRRRTS